MNNKIVTLGLILIGIASRLLPHEANFTAVGAIALFSGFYFSIKHSLGILIITMLISDIFLGFHSTMTWVYGSFILIAMLSAILKDKFKGKVFLFPFISAMLFFMITNFGVWISGNIYPHSFRGLIECYMLAIPFFRGTLMGDLLYSTIFFGGFKFLNRFSIDKVYIKG